LFLSGGALLVALVAADHTSGALLAALALALALLILLLDDFGSRPGAAAGSALLLLLGAADVLHRDRLALGGRGQVRGQVHQLAHAASSRSGWLLGLLAGPGRGALAGRWLDSDLAVLRPRDQGAGVTAAPAVAPSAAGLGGGWGARRRG